MFVTEQAKSVLLECQGAEKIVKKLGDLEKNFDEKSDNRIELAACGSLLNVASDDGEVLYVFFLVVAGRFSSQSLNVSIAFMYLISTVI